MRINTVKAALSGAVLLGAFCGMLAPGAFAQDRPVPSPGFPEPAQTQAPDISAQPPMPNPRTNELPLLVPSSDMPSQGAALMTINQDELFMNSVWGQRVQAYIEARSVEIAAENDRIADELAAEEQELTTLRGTLTPEEFSRRADEFDARVVEVRRTRDVVGRELQQAADEERTAFFRAALPILADVMRERGAVAVLDQRMIFVAAESIDVTDLLIARLNAEVGEGPARLPQGPNPNPATAPQGTTGAAPDGAASGAATQTPAPSLVTPTPETGAAQPN